MDKHVFTDKQKKLIAWAAIAIFLLLSAAVGWFIGRPLVRFASRPEEFRLWVDGHGLLGMAAYVGMVFLQVVVAVIPGEPLEISGGYAFGALRGSVLCLLGGVLGSVAVFALVRRFGRELVEIFFPREKLEKLKFLQSSPKRDALFWLIFTVPGTPKDLLCYFAGLTDLSWGKWLLLCTVGRLPSVLTSTIGGSALGVKDYQFAILVFAVTLAVSGVGLLIYRANRDYIRKEGRWLDDGKHETNLPETFEESGDLPPERDKRQSVSSEILEMISSGASNAEILMQFPSAMNRLQHIEAARQTLLENRFRSQWRDLQVTYLWGKTGDGKTRSIMELYGYENVFHVTNYAHPFDDYRGQDVILFDEFRSSLPIADMLKFLDGYPLMLPCRYSNKVACFTKVFLVSNIPLSDQYPNVQVTEPETYRAFCRRINQGALEMQADSGDEPF